MTTKIDFWSDHIDAPKAIFANLKDDTIKARMVAWLEQQSSEACDLWACKTVIDSTQWIETRFCFVKQNGLILEESVE